MAIDKYTLLNIIEKFPTKESRNVLRDILSESSDELKWRNEISHIFYILNKLDKESKTENMNEPENYNENGIQTIIDLKMEPELPEPIVEPEPIIEPEPIVEPEPIQLTELEKIQLQFREEIDRITKNKNDEILKYSISYV